MNFSYQFNIQKTPTDDWYDVILPFDTKLFVDPFLIKCFGKGLFNEAYSDIITFFNHIYKIVSDSKTKNSPKYKAAQSALYFPELSEIRLGYSKGHFKGSGSGKNYGDRVIEAMEDAISEGMLQISRFEEIFLFCEGIGADRISDMTTRILLVRFVKYTQQVCQRHNIVMNDCPLNNAYYSYTDNMWKSEIYNLPFDKHSSKAIILVPQFFLRNLPTINKQDFWSFSYDNRNETLRNLLGLDIQKNVKASVIIDTAKRSQQLREAFIQATDAQGGVAYDFNQDPDGLLRWLSPVTKYVADNPLSTIIKSTQDLKKAVAEMIRLFQHFIEQDRGFKLLWKTEDQSKSEDAAQIFFKGMIISYCRAYNIDISREAHVGTGTVDFKFSIGDSIKVLLEIKLAKNGKYWNGITKQTPSYLHSENANTGFILTICYNEKDIDTATRYKNDFQKLKNKPPYDIELISIDASYRKITASKL